MDYTKPLRYHYKPKRGWMNDPNGLVYFKGYYHVFYQHAPQYPVPWQEPMHWGHARTKDFLNWEELPVALTPGRVRLSSRTASCICSMRRNGIFADAVLIFLNSVLTGTVI